MSVFENPLKTAQDYLLNPFGIDESHLQQCFSEILKHRVDYADLYFQYEASECWFLEEGIVKRGSFSIDQGVGVRAISFDKTAYAYADEISASTLMKAAQNVRAIASAGQNKRIALPTIAPFQVEKIYSALHPLKSLSAEQKVALLENLEHYARSIDPRIQEVMASLSGVFEVVLMVNHQGKMSADVRPLIRCSIQVIAQENGKREMGSSGGGARVDYSFLTQAQLEKYANEAVHQALLNLNAKAAPAGQMSVVLGNGWPGILLHEAVGHGLEGDFNRKGTSVFANRLGEKVAADGVTVIDDGAILNRRGSLSIDDEGTPTSRQVLIENGILKGYLWDYLNAQLTGRKSTGNGRRESYAYAPIPRMTNTFMLGGKYTKDEIIASVQKGIYAVNFGGGQVDITNGKFVFSMNEAYLIENGKITHPIKGATLIGNGADALLGVSLVGNDLSLDSGVGVCGKDGQSVPVGVGMPTLRIEGLTVGGTAI